MLRSGLAQHNLRQETGEALRGALILTGGRSGRFGENKALARFVRNTKRIPSPRIKPRIKARQEET